MDISHATISRLLYFLKTPSSIPPLQVLRNRKTFRGPTVFVYKFFALPKCSPIQWLSDKVVPCVIITLRRTVKFTVSYTLRPANLKVLYILRFNRRSTAGGDLM